MRILFDQGTPLPLRRELTDHYVATALEMGWATLSNGELFRLAEVSFDLLVTTDQNLRYQQNLADRKIAILVLPTTSWPAIRRHLHQVVEAVRDIRPAEFRQLMFIT